MWFKHKTSHPSDNRTACVFVAYELNAAGGLGIDYWCEARFEIHAGTLGIVGRSCGEDTGASYAPGVWRTIRSVPNCCHEDQASGETETVDGEQ